eukprot:TRINITY_DN16742_c0_g1_i1.p1 TRINITY_DN16742_c0_g1~~TRINITY_DN16742_c0_g1_i1.p1  ORF type:complete len:242 (+),score=64.12 TRINITY_DN16742_c0_g1_i1:27-728(+)
MGSPATSVLAGASGSPTSTSPPSSAASYQISVATWTRLQTFIETHPSMLTMDDLLTNLMDTFDSNYNVVNPTDALASSNDKVKWHLWGEETSRKRTKGKEKAGVRSETNSPDALASRSLAKGRRASAGAILPGGSVGASSLSASTSQLQRSMHMVQPPNPLSYSCGTLAQHTPWPSAESSLANSVDGLLLSFQISTMMRSSVSRRPPPPPWRPLHAPSPLLPMLFLGRPRTRS